MYDVFVSYSSKDKKIADAVVNYLESVKIKCWIAYRDAEAGELYAASIIKAIKNASIYVLVFSENSNKSKHVLKEIDAACKNEKTIIPFKIDSCQVDDAVDYYLSSTHWLDAITQPLDTHLKRLVELVNKHLGKTANTLNNSGDSEITQPEAPQPEESEGKPDTVSRSPKAPFFLKNRKILYAGIAAVAVLIIGFAVIWSQRDKIHIKNGATLFDKGEYDKAIEEFDKAIEINPKSSDAYSWRGVLYSNKGDVDAAIADQTKAIELNPKNALAYSRRAASFATKKIVTRAREDLKEALRLDPDNAQILNHCGNAYFDLGDKEQALEAYAKAIQINPKYPGSYFSRGKFYLDNEKYEDAVSDYNEGLRLDRNNAQGYYNRGIAYYRSQQYDNALADYDEAIRLDPQYADAYRRRGSTFFMLQQYEEAISDYSIYIQLEPEKDYAYANRAEAYYYLGQYENAVADCGQALHYPYAHSLRAAAYNGLQRYEDAIAECNEALRLHPRALYAHSQRANAYYALGQYDKARSDYETALLYNPEDYFAHRGMLQLYSHNLWEYDKALINLDEAIRLSPYPYDKYLLLNSRAFLCFYLGRLDEAMVEINKAIELVPNPKDAPFIIDTRGTIYRAMGDYGKAIEDYSTAIRYFPDYAIAWMNRAIAYLWSGDQSSYEEGRNKAVQLYPEEAAEAWIDIGKNQLQTGLYDKAAESFRSALAIHPESDEARKLLAKARAGR